MIDLIGEFLDMAAQVTPQHDLALASLGVPINWLRGWPNTTRYGVTRATLPRSGAFWEPHPDGEPVCVLPDQIPLDGDDPLFAIATFEPSDLIAFRPRDPSRWWRRVGDAVLINREAVERAKYLDEPLPVHPDPLAWMVARGAGVVIVDWGRRPLRLHLSGPPSLVCATYELADRLDRRFKAERRDDTPRLTFMQEEVAAV
ncbi:hypothetical protein [Rhodospira trueperi]|uniref:Uncharacterized protein n=1 Tax=Rhodospira trueperi TaxID=69960 RepID=A0A1G7GYJ3_9PROT|nr:hypothetical protein [Rhodospira trueperi]SDE93133.1 hypothetical protein SAMN05421720_11656 [Rhodospira trueperi]